MSMKEKALLIKEDFDQLFDAGKQSVIANSKYIEKTASGKVIRLDDVSEVYHNVKVKADTPTEVKVYGKNIFDGLLESGAIDSTTGINLGTVGKRSINYIPIVPNTTYTITREFTTGNIRTRFYDADKNYIGYGFIATNSPMTFTTKDNYYYLRLDLVGDTNNLTEKVQVEFGSASEYEEYKGQTITATPSGTEIPSNCPAMTFLADSDVTVDYYGSYGMQTEYDGFWDEFQQNGTRVSYNYAFYGGSWTEAIFKPKYDIVPTHSTQAFYSSPIKNLTSVLEKQGVVLDTSNCIAMSYTFAHSKLENIPKLDMSVCTNSSAMLVTCTSLVQIGGIVSSGKTGFSNDTFQNCSALEHCIFEGTIATNINLQWSKKLDMESLGSLFRCLKNFRSDDPDNMYTKTITLSAESWALLDTYVYENGWNDYVDAKDVVAVVLGWNYA